MIDKEFLQEIEDLLFELRNFLLKVSTQYEFFTIIDENFAIIMQKEIEELQKKVVDLLEILRDKKL